MDHPEFYRKLGPFSLSQIASFLNADLKCLDETFLIYDFNSVNQSKITDICFLNDNYDIKNSNIESNTFLISKNNKNIFEKEKNIIKVDDLHLSIARLSNYFYKSHDEKFINSLNSPVINGNSSYIDKAAIILNGSELGINACIKSGVHIGHNCLIGKNVSIGNNSTLSNCIIGDNVKIGSNCSIGQSGFGFAINNKNNENIFHKGRVILQNYVQIGSNCCIDRGSFNDTIVGENTYFDNLCHVAHNVVIGRNCIFAACTGIAGSASIGDSVLAGGQVGISGHIRVGNRVRIAARSAVLNDINDDENIMGYPAMNRFKYLKNYKKNYGRKSH